MTVTIPTIETERLILRAPELSDFDVMCEFYASERATYVGGQMKPEQVWRHLACEISQETALRVVALPHTEGALWSTTPPHSSSMLTY